MEMKTRPMTIDEAEAIGAVAADVGAVLFNALHAHPKLDWLDLIIAGATAMRGVAAHACTKNADLSNDIAIALMTHTTLQVFALPDGLVKLVDDGTTDKDGPVKTGFLPVRRH